jgi:hypothetical protein
MFVLCNWQVSIYVCLLCFRLVVTSDSLLTYEDIDDELRDFEIRDDSLKQNDAEKSPKFSKTMVNSEMINDELMENTWNYMAECVFILLLAILTVPANAFLFFLYTKKIYRYKKFQTPKINRVRSSSIQNSFNTYMIEICLFDTLIVVYLVSNTLFQFFFYLKKTQYESVFDISNFACKFFIYILRISGAMSNYLVLLLALNRCMLLHFK